MYEYIPDISTELRESIMRFALRAKQELANHLVLWTPNHRERGAAQFANTINDRL